MKVLVCSNVFHEMHIATTIEIIQNHLDKKNKVYFLDTVVYSKHLRFFKNDKEVPINNLKKHLMERIL